MFGLVLKGFALAGALDGPKATTGDQRVVCYYTSWSHYRHPPYGLTPDRIDPFLCTHIVYAFADIGHRNNLISSDPYFDFDKRKNLIKSAGFIEYTKIVSHRKCQIPGKRKSKHNEGI